MSPRRSSRASRSIQPAPSDSRQSNPSSSSSMASGRASRSAGPDQKSSSQRSSVAAHSQSSEDPDSAPKPQARRTRSSLEEVNNEMSAEIQEDMDKPVEEDEVTRCICGKQEFPGRPVSNLDSTRGGTKGSSDLGAAPKELTGWFIQCDDCEVWQHGCCVGLFDEANAPEKYYCDSCRGHLHKITVAANG